MVWTVFAVKAVRPERLLDIGERCGMSGAVRDDRLLPHTEPSEIMRGHVQRMRDVRRDLRIADCCVQAGLCRLGRIVTVDQIVDDAGVIWLLGPNLVEYLRRPALIGVGLIGWKCR